jgi:pyruvate ferredoxin oxidoreductase gamma subunit/2-oxoisovalerate ferredoxin oxidoreductase gamma subunit
MYEVRFHGRGGQGAVTAARLLADAAFREGKDVQSFPIFGVERRGAPVAAFTRMDDKPIDIKTQIYEPDTVIVLDPTLVGVIDVAQGLKDGGNILVNSTKKAGDFSFHNAQVYTVDATGIALKHTLGTKTNPIINTAILGAYSRVIGNVGMAAIEKAIDEKVPIKQKENKHAAQEAYTAMEV